MGVALLTCAKQEMLGVIHILNSEVVKSPEIICRIQQQYGEYNQESMESINKIYEWINHFKNCQIFLYDDQQKNKSSTSKKDFK